MGVPNGFSCPTSYFFQHIKKIIIEVSLGTTTCPKTVVVVNNNMLLFMPLLATC